MFIDGGDSVGLPLTALGPGALLSIAILLLLFGRLVTRRELDDIKEDRDKWRETAQELSGQVAELLEHSRTTDAFIRSLPHPLYGQRPPQHASEADL